MDQPSEWVPETKQIFTPISCEICVMKSACASSANLQGLSQVRKSAPAFEQLLWDTFFSKQESVTPGCKQECVLWVCSLRDRKIPPEMNC